MKKFNWNIFWDKKAKENFISSTGKTTLRKEDFFLYIYYIIKNLKGINNNDIILDAGGGSGYLAYCLSPIVKKIYSFDFSKKLVLKSIKINKNNKNVRVYQDNILLMDNKIIKKKIFTKIIVGSVLQYLDNYKEIEKVFQNLKRFSSKKTVILFTHNLDIKKRSFLIKSYKNLNWNKEKILKSLKMETVRFWLNYEILKKIAKKNNYKIKKIKIDKFFFQSTHMFDFLLMRKDV
tara:strand:- start:106 stop:807 length:702 start_codon:yes stop_codon:yes gene_type:complete